MKRLTSDDILDKVERNFGWIMAVWFVIVIIILAVGGFVAWHFLAKVW